MAQQNAADTERTEIQTSDEAHEALAGLVAGDRITLNGDTYEVTSTKMANGTPFVDCRARGHYSRGTTTIKPGSTDKKPVVAHGRGMTPRYYSAEIVARSLEHQPEDAGEDEDEDEDPDGGEGRLVADGGVVAAEDEGHPHRHTTVWAAAKNLEQHEDGSAPRVGVEYRQKNGNGTSRKAGEVERIEVQQPAEHFGRTTGQPTPRIVFRRDDGQQMYVEPDGLYTSGSHAPYVGSVVALSTSTTSTVAAPEGLAEAADEGSEGEDSESEGSAVYTPTADSLADLAAWVNRSAQNDRTNAEVGTTHYSWDIPGFSKRDDPHNGRTAKQGGECAYLVVRGPRGDVLEQALAQYAHQHDFEVHSTDYRATLVPPQTY